MLLSDALEVAIGLTFVFLLVSIAMTALLELIETVTRTRGAQLLGDPSVKETGVQAAQAIYTHPLVQGLFPGSFKESLERNRLPSYIPTRNFAFALIDQVLAAQVNAARCNASIPGPAHASLGDRLRLAAERVENEQVRRALVQTVKLGGDDIERVAAHLGDWYDSAMDRVSGRYKRRSHRLLFWLGLLVAILLNVNTFSIAESLSKNATLRRAVVAQAEARATTGPAEGTKVTESLHDIDRLGLPIGWSSGAIAALTLPVHMAEGTIDLLSGFLGGLEILTGYLLTALAVTLGAPFWFDMLNRMMVIRATVKPREKSPEEGSEDRPQSGKLVTLVTETARPPPAAPLPLTQRPIDRDIYAHTPRADEKPFERWD